MFSFHDTAGERDYNSRYQGLIISRHKIFFQQKLKLMLIVTGNFIVKTFDFVFVQEKTEIFRNALSVCEFC